MTATSESSKSNPTELTQYAMVRVRRLTQSLDTYNGWNFNQRSPAVGDVGTIVDILHAPGLPDNYIVESSRESGFNIWLGDFRAEELEAVDPNAAA